MSAPTSASASAATAPIHWPAEDLWLQLSPLLPGLTLEVLPTIDSSNTELMRRARTGQVDPIVLIAQSQTAGRGRMGRSWVNQPGDCLMYSLGLCLQPQDWSGLSLVVGLSIAQSLQASTSSGPQLGVKWPNDLWLSDGRKLAGTLVETASIGAGLQPHIVGRGTGPARFVVIGTGINIRAPQAHPGLTTPAAGLHDLDARWSAPLALQRLLPPLVQDLLTFAEHGFAPFVQRFAQRDVLRGRPVQLSDGTEGLCEGVDTDGSLLVHTPQGLRRTISGEVSVRPTGLLA